MSNEPTSKQIDLFGDTPQETNGTGKPGYALTSLEVEGFRGLNKLRLEGLGRVNLFIGKNNCGKTSVLEAVALALDPYDRAVWDTILGKTHPGGEWYVRREGRTQDIEWLFFHPSFSTEMIDGNRFSIVANGNEVSYVLQQKEVELPTENFQRRVPRMPRRRNVGESLSEEQKGIAIYLFVNRESEKNAEPEIVLSRMIFDLLPENQDFTSESYRLFQAKHKTEKKIVEFSGVNRNQSQRSLSQLISYGKKEKKKKTWDLVMQVLQFFDSRIEALELLEPNRLILESENPITPKFWPTNAIPHIRTNHMDWVPLGAYGDGVKKSLAHLLSLATVENGALLIDEFEVGMHYTVLEEVLTLLIMAAQKFNVQLYLTTHSLEAIDILANACEKAGEEDFITYHLHPQPEEVIAKRWDFETFRSLRDGMGMEIR